MKKILLFLLLLFTSKIYSQNVRSYVPKNGLIAWYPFTGNADDSSGNGNNGTVFGATLTMDRFSNPNSAYTFNGTNTYIISPGGNQYVNSKFSVSYWINYAPNTFSFTGCVVALGSSSSCLWGTAYINSTPGLSLEAGIGCGGSSSTVVEKIDSNTWYNMTYVVFDSLVTVYVNAAPIGTEIISLGGGCSTANLYFGVDIFSSSEYLTGQMDDIGIWNRELTQCEITQLYLSQKLGIITNPVNDTVFSSGTATYSIKDTGSATYQWQQNSGTGFMNLSNAGPYSGVTTKTLTINPVTGAMNNYLYRCIRSGTCPDTSSNAALVINTSGINTIQTEKNSITIYPNPSKDIVTIDGTEPIKTLEVFDMLGKRVISQLTNCTQVTISLSSLATGIYTIRINGFIAHKLIKE